MSAVKPSVSAAEASNAASDERAPAVVSAKKPPTYTVCVTGSTSSASTWAERKERVRDSGCHGSRSPGAGVEGCEVLAGLDREPGNGRRRRRWCHRRPPRRDGHAAPGAQLVREPVAMSTAARSSRVSPPALVNAPATMMLSPSTSKTQGLPNHSYPDSMGALPPSWRRRGDGRPLLTADGIEARRPVHDTIDDGQEPQRQCSFAERAARRTRWRRRSSDRSRRGSGEMRPGGRERAADVDARRRQGELGDARLPEIPGFHDGRSRWRRRSRRDRRASPPMVVKTPPTYRESPAFSMSETRRRSGC